jgi:hypothetical protein
MDNMCASDLTQINPLKYNVCNRKHTLGGISMDLRSAAQLINTTQRRESDSPIVHILDCTSCGESYARLPQDIALAERNGSLQLCNLCQDIQRRSQKSSRIYAKRNGNMKWSDSLGIAYPTKGSVRNGDGPYTEIMHLFETWLQDVHKCVAGQEIEWETRKQLQKQFFLEFIEDPNLFSTQPIRKIIHYGEEVYVCTGCQAQMSPNYFIKCCPSKKPKSI